MPREITTHMANDMNKLLRIEVLDEPGPGGANHLYGITSMEPRDASKPPAVTLPIRFQNGGIQEAGINGVSNEALLAIVEDRLKAFQSGPYSCRENSVALTKLQECMMWLERRTRDRLGRGVEGRQAK